MYSCPQSKYTVHCAFPATFFTEAFVQEQESKPELTKRMEGTTGSMEELQKRFPSAETVAYQIIAAVEKGDFAICEDCIESALLFSNMIGPSPKRGFGVVDSVLSVLMSVMVWPILRRRYDGMCKEEGKRRH